MTTLSTHDTKRREDVRARLARALRDAPGVGGGGRPGARAGRALPRADAARRRDRVPAVADARRGLADRRTSGCRATAEGDPRGEVAHDLDRAGRGLRGGGARRSSTGSTGDAAVARHAGSPGVDRTRRAGSRSTSSARSWCSCTLPGVPDVYQGTELVDLSLVDPDNRRPVDFAERGAAGSRGSTAARRQPTSPTRSCSSRRGRCGCAASTRSGSRGRTRPTCRWPAPSRARGCLRPRRRQRRRTSWRSRPGWRRPVAAGRLGRPRARAAGGRLARRAHRRRRSTGGVARSCWPICSTRCRSLCSSAMTPDSARRARDEPAEIPCGPRMPRGWVEVVLPGARAR